MVEIYDISQEIAIKIHMLLVRLKEKHFFVIPITYSNNNLKYFSLYYYSAQSEG